MYTKITDKLDDRCEDCVEYGSEFCHDCLKQMKEEQQVADQQPDEDE